MFDTMTLTKTLGALCGALLVFLLGAWAAESIYHAGGHGEHAQAYVIEVEDAEEATDEPAEEAPDFATLLAAADPADGEALWRNCRACHALEDGVNGTGPHLYGVVGRDVAAVAEFNYSGALVQVAEVWTPENLNAFLEDPDGYAPGTAMGYAGMRRAEDRAALIAYLSSVGS